MSFDPALAALAGTALGLVSSHLANLGQRKTAREDRQAAAAAAERQHERNVEDELRRDEKAALLELLTAPHLMTIATADDRQGIHEHLIARSQLVDDEDLRQLVRGLPNTYTAMQRRAGELARTPPHRRPPPSAP